VLCDQNIIGTPSEIFVYLRQSSENVRKMFGDIRTISRRKSRTFIVTEGPVYVNFNTCIGISSLPIVLFIYIVPTSRESSSSIGRISKELIFSQHKYSTWRHHRIFPLSTKWSSCYFLISTGAKLDLFIESGPIKLNSLYYPKWFQDQISSCVVTK